MPSIVYRGVGPRIAYERRIASLTQADLARTAGIALGTLRKVERGERGISDAVLDAVATALDIDPARLLPDRERPDDRVHQAMPTLSAVLAEYDAPEDAPCRGLPALGEAVALLVAHRLSAQYMRIAGAAPDLIAELCRALATADPGNRSAVARLLTDACRAADAVAFKYGARDLSARLIDLMRWAADQANDPLMDATVAYVRTETYFAARAHVSGLRALERAVDAAPSAASPGRACCPWRTAHARSRDRGSCEQRGRGRDPPRRCACPWRSGARRRVRRDRIRARQRTGPRGVGGCESGGRPPGSGLDACSGVEAATGSSCRAAVRLLHRTRPCSALGGPTGCSVRVVEGCEADCPSARSGAQMGARGRSHPAPAEACGCREPVELRRVVPRRRKHVTGTPHRGT